MADLITIISRMVQLIWNITLSVVVVVVLAERGGGERTEGECPHPERNLRFFLQVERQYKHELSTKRLCQSLSLSFHLSLINSLLFLICNTSLTERRPDAVALPQWENKWDQGNKLKGCTFTLSGLNGGRGNPKVIYAWGQVTPICAKLTVLWWPDAGLSCALYSSSRAVGSDWEIKMIWLFPVQGGWVYPEIMPAASEKSHSLSILMPGKYDLWTNQVVILGFFCYQLNL